MLPERLSEGGAPQERALSAAQGIMALDELSLQKLRSTTLDRLIREGRRPEAWRLWDRLTSQCLSRLHLNVFNVILKACADSGAMEELQAQQL